ncbi:MAG: DMT family transporter [Gammaproteobacteria bacterium WSBS_2016_MAG_OTU1]
MPTPPTDNLPAAFAVMMLGVLLVAAMDATAKVLTASLPLPQIVWSRFIFHSLWMTPIILNIMRRNSLSQYFDKKSIIGHAARGILIVLSTVFYFAAIRDNPIPDAIAVFFVEPIFVMFLAALFLGEKLRLRRLVGAGIAFIGVLIVLRPGGGVYSPTILFALLAGLSFAGYIITTRVSSMQGSPLITAWATALAGTIWALPTALWYWQWPNLNEWLLLILMGLLAAGGHVGISYACRMANASLVALFHYSEIIAAAALSYVVFNHLPDGHVWSGFALIAGAKVIIVVLEIREKQQGLIIR